MLREIQLQTTGRDQLLDITDQVRTVIRQTKVKDGVVIVYCPHTTAGVTINENADPDVGRDLLRRLDETFPRVDSRDQHSEGNSAAHLKASIMGCSQTLLVADGQLVLGTWQGIYFCEFDGPRRRKIYIKIQESHS